MCGKEKGSGYDGGSLWFCLRVGIGLPHHQMVLGQVEFKSFPRGRDLDEVVMVGGKSLEIVRHYTMVGLDGS